MDTEKFKARLQEIEKELVAQINEAQEAVRETGDADVQDSGDVSVDDHIRDEQLTEADADSDQLTQVRDALQRIEDGTYGACVVDGKPIEEKRLEAMPWTPYCLEHQQQREDAEGLETPSL